MSDRRFIREALRKAAIAFRILPRQAPDVPFEFDSNDNSRSARRSRRTTYSHLRQQCTPLSAEQVQRLPAPHSYSS